MVLHVANQTGSILFLQENLDEPLLCVVGEVRNRDHRPLSKLRVLLSVPRRAPPSANVQLQQKTNHAHAAQVMQEKVHVFRGGGARTRHSPWVCTARQVPGAHLVSADLALARLRLALSEVAISNHACVDNDVGQCTTLVADGYGQSD